MRKYKTIALIFFIVSLIGIFFSLMFALMWDFGDSPYPTELFKLVFWLGVLGMNCICAFFCIYSFKLIKAVEEKFADLKDEIHHVRELTKKKQD